MIDVCYQSKRWIYALFLVGCLSLVAGSVACFVSIAFRTTGTNKPNLEDQRPSRWELNTREETMFPDFPSKYIDIWPDHQSQSKLSASSVLMNHCLKPRGDNDCAARQANGSLQEIRIELVRSPGVFGRLFDDFVGAFVETLGPSGKMIQTTHTVVPSENQGINENPHVMRLMIRLAILPHTLEAMDLALSLNPYQESAEQLPPEIGDDSLAEFSRLWAAWHCRISSFATARNDQSSAIPLLTIPLDLLLAYPMKVEMQMAEFMGIPMQSNDKRKPVPTDRRITYALERIDTCYALSMAHSFLKVPEVPDCSDAMQIRDLPKAAPPWLGLGRRILADGESVSSVCRSENENLATCRKTSVHT